MAHILIIDDSIFICKMIEKILGNSTTKISFVPNARDAFQFVASEVPDLILLSYVFQDIEGPEICVQLKQKKELKKIPVIFLTSKIDEKSIVKGFEAGATDYIAKPFSPAELRARVACHLQNKMMADRLRIANHRLMQMMDEIRRQSNRDPLTTIYNRKFFLENLDYWKSHVEKNDKSAYFLLIDVDTFKSINDTYGHISGDYVLFTVADYLRSQSPDTAYPIRWGGDEFLLLVLDCEESVAMALGEKIRQQVKAHIFTYDCDGSSFSCTLTIGISQFCPEKTLEEMLEITDKALYLGKKRGRNCCISSNDPDIKTC